MLNTENGVEFGWFEDREVKAGDTAKDRARTHEFFAMKWNPEPAVVFTPDEIAQAARCAKGEHEEADDEVNLGNYALQYCKHCRCLFVGR